MRNGNDGREGGDLEEGGRRWVCIGEVGEVC